MKDFQDGSWMVERSTKGSAVFLVCRGAIYSPSERAMNCATTNSSALWWILKINRHFRLPVGAFSNRTE